MASNNPLINPWLVGAGSGIIATVVGGLLLDLLTGDGSIRAGVWIGFLGLVFFVVAMAWYWAELGYKDSAAGSEARERYDLLRNNLLGLNPAGVDIPWGKAYREVIASQLNRLSKWLGDRDQPNSDRLCTALKLNHARPLWTVASYDRCLLTALLYPFLSVLLLWAATGQTGAVEQALGLNNDVSRSSRWVFIGSLAFMFLSFYVSNRVKGIISVLWFVGGAIVFVFASAIANDGDGDGDYAGAGVYAVVVAIAAPFVVSRIFAVAGTSAVAGAVVFASTVAVTGIAAAAGSRVFSAKKSAGYVWFTLILLIVVGALVPVLIRGSNKIRVIPDMVHHYLIDKYRYLFRKRLILLAR